jgi:hypothetical protein
MRRGGSRPISPGCRRWCALDNSKPRFGHVAAELCSRDALFSLTWSYLFLLSNNGWRVIGPDGLKKAHTGEGAKAVRPA